MHGRRNHLTTICGIIRGRYPTIKVSSMAKYVTCPVCRERRAAGRAEAKAKYAEAVR